MLKANLTLNHLLEDHELYPRNGLCKSGHKVEGEVRFFYISGETLPSHRWGAYCEGCVKAAFDLNHARKTNVNR